MKQLTLRQQEILDFLTSFIEKNSFPPTVRETAKAFSISIKGAYDHIKALEKKGVIKLQENRSRALEIVSKKGNDESVAEIPVLGNIAAGNPILAEENWMGTHACSFRICPRGNLFRPPRPGRQHEGRGHTLRRHGPSSNSARPPKAVKSSLPSSRIRPRSNAFSGKTTGSASRRKTRTTPRSIRRMSEFWANSGPSSGATETSCHQQPSRHAISSQARKLAGGILLSRNLSPP